jgi:hypothetical protein
MINAPMAMDVTCARPLAARHINAENCSGMNFIKIGKTQMKGCPHKGCHQDSPDRTDDNHKQHQEGDG